MKALAFYIFLLTACAQADQEHFPVVRIGTNCASTPAVINTNFIKTDEQEILRLMDESLTSENHSLNVGSGEVRFIDVDYRCSYQFHSFQLRNMATNKYAFGQVSVYSKDSFDEPWRFEGTFNESLSTRGEGYNWTWEHETMARFIRYEMKNSMRATTDFIISDIECAASFLHGN